MSALIRLADATAEFASAQSELDSDINGVVDHRERHAVGALCADVQNVCTYIVPEVVLDQVMLTRQEIALHERMPRPAVESMPYTDPEDWLARTAEITRRWIAEGGAEEQQEYWEQLEALHKEHLAVYARFILGFKQAYFSIRALQDALYRVGITITEGNRPGSYAGMKNALNNDMNPVRRLLGRDAEHYFTWFSRWRHLRNGIKLGRGIGY